MIPKDKNQRVETIKKITKNLEILLRIKMGKNLAHERSDKLIRSKVMKPGSKLEIEITLTLIK